VSVAARHVVGRQEELGEIVGLLDAREQLARVAVLSGEAGIGKTTVWLAGVEAATARGYRVLSSRPSEAETKFSFVGLADLLDDAAAEVLAELQGTTRSRRGFTAPWPR
jgi:primosomal protein N'